MAVPIVSGEETKQLQALHSLRVLDIQPEARLERVTTMAKRLFGVPIAVLWLDDGQREAREHAAAISLFESARRRSRRPADELFIVADAFADARFGYTPAVLEGRKARFYASCPVHAGDGGRTGTLSLIDTQPRNFSAEDVALLRELGSMIDEVLRSLSMATSDDLTKLANRRGFAGIAAHILPMALRLNIPLALIQFDLDDFKLINDRDGHEAGDRALISFARQLLKNFRESDVVARLGGDEFCVLMSGTSQAEVVSTLKRLKTCLGRESEPVLQFSAGVAMLDRRRHAVVDDLLRDADRRMYECKRRKRAASVKSAG